MEDPEEYLTTANNSEIFTLSVGNDRHYNGILKRKQDEHGQEFVYGRVNVYTKIVVARGINEEEMKASLIKLYNLKLEYDLPCHSPEWSKILDADYFHN
jgi:hypothetical protein